MLGLITLLTLVSNTIAHSWIACSDYTGKNEADWDPNKCRGFPRDAAKYATKDAFGLDRGFDHKPGNNGKACKTDLNENSYSVDYPMAVYYSGQQAVLVHPMKNHGTSAKCGNIHIPDFGNAIYNGSRWNSDTDPVNTNEAYSFYKPFLVTDLGTSVVGSANKAPDTYPKPGYQNAPKFCENTDKAFASYSFNVPAATEMAPGFYTFVWRWSFNGPTDIYTTCFDVEIVPTKEARDSRFQLLGIQDTSTICGGTLSNLGDGSNVGCNGVTAPPVLPSTDGPVVTQNPTNGPITQEPTNGPITQAPTQVPTQPPVSGEALAPKAYQIAGEFDLPTPEISGVKARYATVMFQCEVEAMFWNARVIGVDNAATGKIFQLVQESEADVLSRKIYFSSMFSGACDLLKYPPIANFVKDEK